MPRCSASGTLSVPMSNPRYTAVESQLTTSPPNRCAIAMASALLPVAVGPTIASSRGVTCERLERPRERDDHQGGERDEQPEALRAGRHYCPPPPGGVSLK